LRAAHHVIQDAFDVAIAIVGILESLQNLCVARGVDLLQFAALHQRIPEISVNQLV
jgi:hypothetical protein